MKILFCWLILMASTLATAGAGEVAGGQCCLLQTAMLVLPFVTVGANQASGVAGVLLTVCADKYFAPVQFSGVSAPACPDQRVHAAMVAQQNGPRNASAARRVGRIGLNARSQYKRLFEGEGV